MSADVPAGSDQLGALFERVTGESTVVERQHAGVSHRIHETGR